MASPAVVHLYPPFSLELIRCGHLSSVLPHYTWGSSRLSTFRFLTTYQHARLLPAKSPVQPECTTTVEFSFRLNGPTHLLNLCPYPTVHPLYIKGNSHWASSSSQASACVVEPANAADISTIVGLISTRFIHMSFSNSETKHAQLKIVANTSTPFGIRSGGHATNAGFSSTPGVQIALFKLSEVTYHPYSGPAAADGSVGTVEFGSGLVGPSFDVYNCFMGIFTLMPAR
jgi:hypothetical protein